MATEFEVIIAQEDVDAAYADQVAHAVFTEVDRLEDELSRFKPGSDIWRINHLKAGESCRVGMATMDCLSLAKAVHQETQGAFDITVGPLMDLFRRADGLLRAYEPEEVEEARQKIGMKVFEAEDGFVTVKVDEPALDLGAVGKGYTLDQVVTVLSDHGITQALLNAGDSTLLAIGTPGDEPGWKITVGNAEKKTLVVSDRAVSTSGFAVKGAHIIDPRKMQPVPVRRTRVWACAPTAALSDALSTAFMVMSREEVEAFCEAFPEVESCLD